MVGSRYGGQDALTLGIAHRAVDEDEVLPTAIAIAAEMAGKDRRTLLEHRRLLYADVIAMCGAPPIEPVAAVASGGTVPGALAGNAGE